MTEFEALLERYDYPLTEELIALTPAEPRDSAKLLVYDRTKRSVEYSTFAHLDDFIPKNALLVSNDTKVIPARLYAKKPTGGVVEILCTEIDEAKNECRALANKKLSKGDTLTIGDVRVTLTHTEGTYTFSFSEPIMKIILREGTTPIPPYLKHTPLTEAEIRARYQTLFAKNDGSIAAPTASLHFTEDLFKKLAVRGVDTAHVTLHVNLGTFAPLNESAVAEGKLHAERFSVSKEAADKINVAKKAGRPVIAVGTTTARTLESAAAISTEQGLPLLSRQDAETRIFIREGYEFKIVDGLITNFHVPRSSLLMLVAALIGREKLLELYKNAEDRGFRFLSFGDGMLLL